MSTDPQTSPPAVAPLASRSPEGRAFTGHRKVRLGDVTTEGRLRLDALTRYTQDVSDDDTTDAGLAPEPGWVVRSTVVDELNPAELAEGLTVTTFCSGLGKRWAERRLSILGDRGARYEVATLWICIDPSVGAPVPLTEQFLSIYGSAADGRKVSARLRNPKREDLLPAGPSSAGPSSAGSSTGVVDRSTWPLRVADYDVYDHVNNAAYWAVVEQSLAADPLPGRRRMRVEYGEGLGHVEAVTIETAAVDRCRALWWLVDDSVVASASIDPLPVDPYDDSFSATDGAGAATG